MSLIDLKKKKNCGRFLQERNFSQNAISTIAEEIDHFDEYYVTPHNDVVKIFVQEFRKDPYMKLESFSEVRVINYPNEMRTQYLEEVVDRSVSPIILRAKESRLETFRSLRFSHILNFEEKPSILIPFQFTIPEKLLKN